MPQPDGPDDADELALDDVEVDPVDRQQPFAASPGRRTPSGRPAPGAPGLAASVTSARVMSGAPFLEARLDATDGFDSDDPGDREQEDPEQGPVALAQLGRASDEDADALGLGVELGGHDADQGPGDAQAKAGDDERHGRRNDDRPEEELLRGVEAAGHVDEAAIRRLHALHRRDDDGEERAQEDDRDLGPGSEDAEHDHEDRQQRDPRQGVEEVQPGVQGVLEAPEPAGGQADRDAQDDRQEVAERELREAREEVAPEPLGLDLDDPGLDDPGRATEEDAVDDPAAAPELPQRQEDDDAGQRRRAGARCRGGGRAGRVGGEGAGSGSRRSTSTSGLGDWPRTAARGRCGADRGPRPEHARSRRRAQPDRRSCPHVGRCPWRSAEPRPPGGPTIGRWRSLWPECRQCQTFRLHSRLGAPSGRPDCRRRIEEEDTTMAKRTRTLALLAAVAVFAAACSGAAAPRQRPAPVAAPAPAAPAASIGARRAADAREDRHQDRPERHRDQPVRREARRAGRDLREERPQCPDHRLRGRRQGHAGPPGRPARRRLRRHVGVRHVADDRRAGRRPSRSTR